MTDLSIHSTYRHMSEGELIWALATSPTAVVLGLIVAGACVGAFIADRRHTVRTRNATRAYILRQMEQQR